MAYTTINKSTDNFNTVLYTGNGSTQSVTGVGFEHKLTWLKERSSTSSHQWVDSVRGYTKRIHSNGNDAQSVDSSPYNDFKSIDSDGFTIGSGGGVNENSQTYVAWNWKANGTGSTNNDGSVTSTVSANTTAGFSICKFTYPSSGNFTFGHGLGVAPKMFILKGITGTANWQVYHESLGNTYNTQLNYTNAASSAANWWGSTSPSSTVCTVGADLIETGQDAIAYVFAEKAGYSKIGSYDGNGNADGVFIYTGFKPAWILLKRSNSGGTSWVVYDNKREGYNVDNDHLQANGSNAEGTSDDLDILSNGFKMRTSGSGENGSGNTYIYMAFGQSLVGSNNVPVTAR